jgi:hypothetical protein
MNHFIQEAILDRLEELADVEDLKKIRHEPTRPPIRGACRAAARWLAIGNQTAEGG